MSNTVILSLPTMAVGFGFAALGGLISYGADTGELNRQAGLSMWPVFCAGKAGRLAARAGNEFRAEDQLTPRPLDCSCCSSTR